MKNKQQTIQQTASKLNAKQLIQKLTAKAIKGGTANACPPPFDDEDGY